jgi:hypothetical protein
MIASEQREFEAIFRRIECNSTWPCRAIETVHGLAFDTRQVDGVVERADNAVVAGSHVRSTSIK